MRGRGRALGNPFRFHVRLFRQGEDTLGNAHFEFLIPGTAEHEVLSWDLARGVRHPRHGADRSTDGAPGGRPMIPAGSFRAVRRPVYDALRGRRRDPDPRGRSVSIPRRLPAGVDVPMPTNGAAAVLAASITAAPAASKVATETT